MRPAGKKANLAGSISCFGQGPIALGHWARRVTPSRCKPPEKIAVADSKVEFSDSEILSILKQAENRVPVPKPCHEDEISSASFYKWRA